MTASEKAPQPVNSFSQRTGPILRKFMRDNRRPLSALLFFIVLLAIFTIANPKLFLDSTIYNAVFVSLPISIILVVPLIFVVTAGEIDLSFPSVVGMCAWAFAAGIRANINRAYAAVKDPNGYRPADFRASLGEAVRSIRALR